VVGLRGERAGLGVIAPSTARRTGVDPRPEARVDPGWEAAPAGGRHLPKWQPIERTYPCSAGGRAIAGPEIPERSVKPGRPNAPAAAATLQFTPRTACPRSRWLPAPRRASIRAPAFRAAHKRNRVEKHPT